MDESSLGEGEPAESARFMGANPFSGKNESASTEASGNLVAEMLDAGIVTVKPTDKFKSGLSKKSKHISEKEKAKIEEMIKGLSKYKDRDEFDMETILSPSKKNKKSPRKGHTLVAHSHMEGGLHEFLDSELPGIKSPHNVEPSSTKKKMFEFAESQTTGASTPSAVTINLLSKMEDVEKHENIPGTCSNTEKQPKPDVLRAFETLKHLQEETMKKQIAAAKKEKKEQKKKKYTQSTNYVDGIHQKKDVDAHLNENVKEQDFQPRSGKVGSYTQLLQTMGNKKGETRQKSPPKQANKETPGKKKKSQAETTATGVEANVDISLQRHILEMHAQEQPLLLDSTWLQQFKYESAEACFHQMLSRKGGKASEEVSPGKKKKKQNNQEKKDGVADRPLSAKQKKKDKQESAVQIGVINDGVSQFDKPLSAKQKKKDQKESAEQSPVLERPLTAGKKKKNKMKQKEPVQGFQLPVAFVDTTTSITVHVHKDEHRYIIGPHRRHLQEIYNITGVNIIVPPTNSPVEEVVLRGDKLQVGPALALMFSKSQHAQNEALQTQGARPRDITQPSPVQGQRKGQQQGQKGKKDQDQQKRKNSSSVPQTNFGQSYFDTDMSQNANRPQMHGQNVNSPQQMRSPYVNSPQQRQVPYMNSQQQMQGPYVNSQQQMQGPYGNSPQQMQGPYGNSPQQMQGPYGNSSQQMQGPYGNSSQQQQSRGRGQQHNRGQGSSQMQWRQQGQLRDQVQNENSRTPDKDVKSPGQGNTPKSQGKRRRLRKFLFAEYMPMEDVSAGLKRGIIIQGPIRINPKNFEEAYVPHPDGRSDIVICGLKDRNRALNGDIVAVQLGEEGDWKLNKDELDTLEEDIVSKPRNGDSDPEVVIESEEIVEIVDQKTESDVQGQLAVDLNNLKIDQAGNNASNQSPMKKSGPKGGNDSPRKKFTSLNEVMSSGSPAMKKMFSDEGSSEVKKMLQRTGKVVAIIEKKHSRACTGHIKPFQDKNTDKALFAPNDHRMPRMMIPISDCPQNFLERPEDHTNTLYVGRITEWRQDSNYADGCLAKSLGEAGEIEPETEGMLIENGVDFEEFPAEALECLPQQNPWCIPEEEFEYRRDFRSDCVFTIDPATARDLDDALSCEDLGDGRYKVGVHIADVSYFIKENSVLDRVAALRSTSVYLVHKVIPMLPRLLCEQLCSLNPDVDRLTFSVEWTITEDGTIEEEWFGRSVIKSCAKLAYDHAQGFIEQPERQWTVDELPPISKNFSVDDIKTRVLNLHKIAQTLRKGRMDGGALRLDQVKLQYSLDPDSGMPNGYWVYQQKDSNRLVEEFMLLANMAVAHRINKDFPDKALLRRHPPPQEKMIENLRDQCSVLGIHIDISSAGSIQRSMSNYYGDDDNSQARMQVLVALCSKPMQNAKYFCTGCIDDESLYHHYALNVPLYTHFTSPIRRYPDVLVHRLLGASLEYCDVLSKSPQEIHKMAENSNDKKTAAKRVGDLSSELFFAVFVKTAGPLEERAMVMMVLDKAFDIFVLKLGVTKRVYCDKLPIKEKLFKRDKKVPSLTLVWPAEKEEPEIRQEITIFTIVDCVLDKGELPLQWTAIIKRPQQLSSSLMLPEDDDDEQ